jgi:HK97 gp10 family phage protein
MSSHTVRLEGLDELKQILKGLPAAMGGEALKEAALEAMEPVLARARQLVPVKSGRLKRSLGIQIRTESRSYIDVRVGANLERSLGETGPHAHLVEFGTGPRYDKDGRFVGVMPAEPFMRPAWDAESRNIEPRFQRVLAKALDRYAREADR